jgi:hypothetical protein
MGGPAEDAISAAAYFAGTLATLHRERDPVFIDQRGTGKSHRLGCDIYAGVDPAVLLRDVFPLAPIERCARELSKNADLTQYSYAHFSRGGATVRSKAPDRPPAQQLCVHGPILGKYVAPPGT